MAKELDERTLGEASLADAVTGVDVSVPPTPENFDLADWVAGIRPTRRAVKLYPYRHLVSDLEQLADRIESTPDGPEVDAMIDRFDALRAKAEQSVWFVIEKRSRDWIERFRRDVAKRHGLNPKTSEDDALTVHLHQMAEQIIQPAGVTAEMLQAMVEANEGEVFKLQQTLQAVNDQLAESAEVLTRDFSDRRSAGTRG